MCVYIYIYIYIHIYIYIYAYTCIARKSNKLNNTQISRTAEKGRPRSPSRTLRLKCVCVHIYIYIYMFILIYLCIAIDKQVRIHIYIYIYIEREREILLYYLYNMICYILLYHITSYSTIWCDMAPCLCGRARLYLVAAATPELPSLANTKQRKEPNTKTSLNRTIA